MDPTGQVDFYYFLFVNTQSGNKQGKNYVTLAGKQLITPHPKSIISQTSVYDLFSSEQTSLGISIVKELVNEGKNVRIIVCGGDGTLMWVLQLIHKNGIDLKKVVIGILPIGTGNDFSRSLGWGFEPITFNIDDFKKLQQAADQWNCAKQGYYDLWDVQIETYPNGCFYNVKNQKEEEMGEKIFKKSFCNYVGIGVDARVVYQVQKNRGQNALMNKVKYGMVGIYHYFQEMKPLNEHLICFKATRKSQIQYKHQLYEKQIISLSSDYRGIVCLNCSSYMCGLKDVWMTSAIGTQNTPGFWSQRVDDGTLEFVGFRNELSLAMERIRRSGAKITQGQGPFIMQFREFEQNEQMFIQIDGESLKVKNIKSIVIKKGTLLDTFKLPVLIHPDNE